MKRASFKKELVKIKIKTRTVIIVLAVLALAIIVSIIIMNHYAEGKADLEDRLVQLKLEQAEIELYLELQNGTDERLSNVEDLNALLEPTKQTFKVLKRWEVVHQIDPDYPYPETEIKEQDWMGINDFLFGEDEEGGAKGEMIYDENNNIDSDVYEYIMNGETDTEDAAVKEAVKQIEK